MKVSKKQKEWDLIAKHVDSMDRLGGKVEDGIKEPVIAARALGFRTRASSEGNSTKNFHLPFIMFGRSDPEYESFRQEQYKIGKEEKDLAIREKKIQDWNRRYWPVYEKELTQVLEELQRMMGNLKAFYRHRRTPYEVMIGYKMGVFPSFTLQSNSADIARLLPEKERNRLLKACRQEMSSFGNFLKQKFFKN